MYDYLIVLDFEATCEDGNTISNGSGRTRTAQEIIEFPMVVVDPVQRRVVAEFHRYVRPTVHPTLTAFCTSLTHIAQTTVDAAEPFPVVFRQAQDFLAPHMERQPATTTTTATAIPPRVCFVTCGDWDLRKMLPAQCSLSGIAIPAIFADWINLKFAFQDRYQMAPRGMTDMLDFLQIPLVGQHHSGIDDSRNITSIVFRMLEGGWKPDAPTNKKKDKQNSKQTPTSTASSSSSTSSSSPSSSSARSAPTKPSQHSQNRHMDESLFAKLTLTDAGVNLTHQSYSKDWMGILTDANKAGVHQMVNIGTSVRHSQDGLVYCEQWKDQDGITLRTTVGVHPHDAKTCNASTLGRLEKMSSSPYVVAIGECGLDFDRNFSPPDTQLEWFEKQIQLALKVKKPLYLHERSAHQDFLRLLTKYKEGIAQISALVHCFTGTADELDAYLKLDGVHIGITGWICDPVRGAHLLEIVPRIPLDKLLIETDAPFLIPKSVRPRPKYNTPAYVGYVAQTLASCFGISTEELAGITSANFLRFFRLAK